MIRRGFVLLGVCLGAAWMMTGSGCLITGYPQWVAPNKVMGEGSCMCSLCWNQPFCFDPTLPEGAQVYGTPPCASSMDEAVEASQVVDALQSRQGAFYCWRPREDAIMNVNTKSCPEDDSVRAQAENLDPCVDVPPCARPVAQCGPQNDPACPEVSPSARPSTCVDVPNYKGEPSSWDQDAIRGASAVVSDLVKTCARYGDKPPAGPQPERYCYLACVNASDCHLDEDVPQCVGCDGHWTIQEGEVTTFPINVGDAEVLVYLKDARGMFKEVGAMPASGRIYFHVPRECQGPDVVGKCTATVTRMALASIGTLRFEGQTVSNVRLVNDEPVTGAFFTNYSSGAFSIPAHTVFGATGDLNGMSYRYSSLDPTSDVSMIWDWGTRVVYLSTILVSEDQTLAVELVGTGTFDSLPPNSVAVASPVTVACGRPTRLSAVNSTDPDGAADIRAVTWTSDQTNSNNWQASGMNVDMYPAAGTHRFYAKVVDSVGSTHTSYVDVTSMCQQ